jgi:hypothetical protein
MVVTFSEKIFPSASVPKIRTGKSIGIRGSRRFAHAVDISFGGMVWKEHNINDHGTGIFKVQHP